ncbi:MAG TPA: nuclear transport factor 2 family protein [Rhizomicrobium sp.]|nr:nuclear transport factor 2 family protein [Rhizomicrobium sp.]
MSESDVSRRKLFVAGTGVLAGTALFVKTSSAEASVTTAIEAAIRKWYGLWGGNKTDWGPLDAALTDDFTFTSPAPDDHINKSTFKKKCWETQIGFIDRIDLELVAVKDDEALVKYHCFTRNGKGFRNVEYLRLRDGRIAMIECYFGGAMTYPSSVSKQG